jgi:hypothetical protein
MNCREAKELIGPYLDSELDARSTLQVRQHLEQCAQCASQWRAEQALEVALRARLKDPPKTPSWWEDEERYVTRAFEQRAVAEAAGDRAAGRRAKRMAWWHELLWPSPAYYAGLAAVWLLLCLGPTGLGSAKQATGPRPSLSRESRLVLLEQRQELRELLASPESTSSAPTEGKASAPHSERGRPGKPPSAWSVPPGGDHHRTMTT